MIGKLAGTIDYKADDHVLIMVGGVGYTVHCAPATLGALPGPGEAAALYVEMVVREDHHLLLGFRTLAEREWHRLLCSVQGVGPRLGLAILGSLGVAALTRALATGEAGTVRQAPGVGPKLATRIVTELKDKAPAMMVVGARGGGAAMPGPAPGPGAPDAAAPRKAAEPADADVDALQAQADAVSALANLGYDRIEAARAVAEAAGAGAEDEAAIIKTALRSLDKNR